MKAMGALVTAEAESMSAMRYGMSQADKAMWRDMTFYRNKGISEERVHMRYCSVVHSSDGWSRTNEMIDTILAM